MTNSQGAVLGANYFGPVAGTPLVPPEVVTMYFVIFFLLLAGAYYVLHQRKKPVHIRHKLKLLFITAVAIKIFLIGGGSLLAAYWLIPRPDVMRTLPLEGEASFATTQKIEIVFDRPVSRKLLQKTITPYAAGIWVFEDSLYSTHLYRKLVFHPTVSLKPQTKYTITLSKIKNLLEISAPYNHSFSFTTQPTPKVLSVGPANGTNNVNINSKITVALTHPNDKVSQFDFELTPSHPVDAQLDPSQKSYTLTPKTPFKQGTQYNLTVKKTDVTYNLPSNTVIAQGATTQEYAGNFTTREPPGIERVTPAGQNVLPATPIVIHFSRPMDKDSVSKHFSITPDALGIITWRNPKTMTFTPARLAYETKYTIKITKGTKETGTGYLAEDIEHSFTTIGAVKVTSISPTDGWSAVGIRTPIKVTFDQEVDKKSAESKFAINPKIPGKFSWEGTTMVFTPTADFPYSTRYTVAVASGVKTVKGLDSNKEFKASFTTQEQTVRLAVPAYLQQHTLSCEVAALRMALAFRNVQVSEEQLLAEVGVDPTPHNGNVWGDPYSAFVGNVDGNQMVDGYGVYWGPIARVARKYRNAKEFEGWSIQQLTEAISQGNPVVIWTYSGGGWPTSWKTPSGKHIFAYRDEHAVTAVGYVGPAANPSQIIINDPLYGQVYWQRGFFDHKWNSFGRSGVVVY